MDKFIDSRFERVEKALATLINSISTYNPSPALANDLVKADTELSEGLQQLSAHQRKYSQILSLRNTTNALDTQIRETLTLLTQTRTALISTPSTSFPENTNPVSYSELLSYARRISKFTIPSTFREPDPANAASNAETAGASTAVTQDGKVTNGTNTPITNGETQVQTQTQSQTQTSMVTAMEIDSSTPTQQTSQNTALPEEMSRWLDPNAELPFIPWPTEESIRRGALASIQVLLDQGVDPATFDPEQAEALEEERKRKVEEEDRKMAEERARMEEERRMEMERRQSMGGPPRPVEEQRNKVFQLETLDDDEDE